MLLDFTPREPIDIVASRRKVVTEPCFASIPRDERSDVKYLMCDIYNLYIAFVDKLCPNPLPGFIVFFPHFKVITRLDFFISAFILLIVSLLTIF